MLVILAGSVNGLQAISDLEDKSFEKKNPEFKYEVLVDSLIKMIETTHISLLTYSRVGDSEARSSHNVV